ncbi:phage portal protein [Streptomyces qinzhouensis]|uniref:Phage portal protein n=1 Tax=Streptomyces qinzhouensis TaxID=2599401 RepID=A0A5B8JEE3_9ACTN|nr:phage portal protein [Streptomyces qinzhouensis]QDY79786.1 phage portal protein [Streptomyces qinzhouensis]
MAETPLQMTIRLYRKLKRRGHKVRTWSDYFEGKHPLLFASPEFSTQTGDLFDGFSDNWCRTIVHATAERLRPLAFRLADGSIDKAAGRAWKRSGCHVEANLALLEALISGRSYALVWKPDGVHTEITFEKSTTAIVEYVPGRRRLRAAGLKVWTDHDLEFATLFTPTMVYRWQRPRRDGGQWTGRTAGLSRGQPSHIPNPLRVVPLVELPNLVRLGASPVSELAPVIPLQNSINALWVHAMTASDERALPARVVLGMDRPVREIIDPDTGEVVGEEDEPLAKFRSDRLLWLERQGASIAEFSAADLRGFLDLITQAVEHVAAQTRTPAIYLNKKLINIPESAVSADESGLVAKAYEKQDHFGAGLQEVMRLEALAAGEPDRAESLSMGSVVWRDPHFRTEVQYADSLVKLKGIGVPDEALWERIPGVTHDEIERWKRMRTDQAAAILGGDLAALYGPKPTEGEQGSAEPVPEVA